MTWWAELFEVPCIGYAASADEVRPLAQAGADFVALGDWIWTHPQEQPRRWRRRPSASPSRRRDRLLARGSRSRWRSRHSLAALLPRHRCRAQSAAQPPHQSRKPATAETAPPPAPSTPARQRRQRRPPTAANPTSPSAPSSAAITSPRSRWRRSASTTRAIRSR